MVRGRRASRRLGCTRTLDLRLFSRVLWRFRLLVGIGLVLACVCAFLSYARIGSSGITYRQQETWRGTVLLFVTQKGFPYGYSVLPGSTMNPNTPATSSRFGNPGWFTSLAVYYAPLVQSDPFQAILKGRTSVKGLVSAEAVVDQHNNPQPYIDLYAYAPTQSSAMTLANAAAGAFQQYILREQVANGIPSAQRVVLQEVSSANLKNTTLFAGRKKTTPIVIFLTILLAAIGLAFVLENLRPRVQSLPGGDEAQKPPVAAQRSA